MNIDKQQVWLVLPSANVVMALQTFPVWRKKGYKIAAIVPDSLESKYSSITDILLTENKIGGYQGWVHAINYLSKTYVKDAEIIVAAGDDMYPDPNYEAYHLYVQFIRHFGGTLGVMQPYGDKFGTLACDVCDKICGSAWIGKEFRDRINKGNGPFWYEYYHMYADTELYQVSNKYDLLWHREDLNQYHEHRLRGKHKFKPTIPNGDTSRAKKIYENRKKLGFPETELL